ncbi:MAG TPA: hypothetical protein VNJ12_02900 [Candidatus Dormibacteraeota bacterium]|nr:hypothetical protein [Candidatus Dormibacteraeota bacterium]
MKKEEIGSVTWIRDLARPYLKGFSPAREAGPALRGYAFTRHADGKAGARAGFFAGFLVGGDGYRYLDPQLPECLLFAFIDPPSGDLHERLVRRPESMFRSTHGYISILTHHPPRFQFSEGGRAALVRHLPLEIWPEGRRMHYARNFLIEGLAWLVRSGLVRNLASESL